MNETADARRSSPPFWRRTTTWLALLMVLFLSFAAVAGYLGWQRRKFALYAVTCRQRMNAGDWPGLSELAGVWAIQQPGNAEPWIFLAEAAQKQGNLSQAADYLRQLPEQDPKSVPALMELATVLFSTLNDPLEAERVCHQILRIDPALVKAHQQLIFYYAVTMQRQRLLQQIDECIRSDCDTPETYVYRILIGSDWNAFSNAHELLGMWLTERPENELFQVAYALHVVKSTGLEDALDSEALLRDEKDQATADVLGKKIDELTKQFPQNVELLAFQLRLASSDGDVDKVTELLQRVPPEAGEDNRFWRHKGWLHVARSEYQAAEEAYLTAIRLNPFDWVTRHQYAELLRLRNRTGEAKFLAELSFEGKTLRSDILKMPDVRSATPEVLVRIEDYAMACGDRKLAERLRSRMRAFGVQATPSGQESTPGAAQ